MMEKFKLNIDPSKYKVNVTYFPTTLGSDKKGVQVSIEDIVNRSSTPEYHVAVSKVRAVQIKKVRDRYKVKFPCFTPHVVLAGGATKEHIIDQTNLLICDWDFLSSEETKKNFPVIAEVLKKHLIYNRFSISGTGAHTLLLIDDPDKRLVYIDKINERFREFGFRTDPAFSSNPVQKAIMSSGNDQILNDSPEPFTGVFEASVTVTVEKKTVKQRVSGGTKKKKENPFSAAIEYLQPRYTVVRDSLSGVTKINGEILNENIISTMIMDALLHGFFANKDFITSWIKSSFVKVEHRFDEFAKKYEHLNPSGNITRLAQSLVVESVPPNYPNFVEDGLRLWLVKLVAQLYERKANDIAIFLVGPQNIGKTSFFQFLMPLEFRDLYTEAAFRNDRDYKSLLIKNILVVDDELKSRIQDIHFVKSTLTNPYVNLRKMYAETDFNYPRLASFGGTSNDPQLLSDPSGNRRFIIWLLSNIKRDVYESIPKEHLFMEAYNLYKAGFELEPPESFVKAIQENSHQFEIQNTAEEILIDYFPPADPAKDEQSTWWWWPVHHLVEKINETRKVRIKEYHIGLALKKLNYHSKYQLVGRSKLRVYAVRPVLEGGYDTIDESGMNHLPPLF